MTPTGAIIMGFFGAVWWVLGVRAAGFTALWLMLVPAIIAVAIVAIALRRGGGDDPAQASEQQRRNGVVGIASAAEGIAILIAVNLLAHAGRQSLTVPVIAIIVGAHFVPIARGFRDGRYYITGGLLIVLGAIGLALPDMVQRLLVVCIGAASVLWSTSVVALRSNGSRL